MITAQSSPTIAEVAGASLARGTLPTDRTNLWILIVSAIAILVTVTIAVWQRHDLRRYRRAEEALKAQRAALERLRQDRRARRESWDPVLNEIQELLIRLEDVGSEAREEGPLDQNAIDDTELGRIQRRLENVSTRCPESLHDPLQAVASAVTKFRNIRIPAETGTPREYARAGIRQYMMAVAMHNAIGEVWETVHTERGDEP